MDELETAGAPQLLGPDPAELLLIVVGAHLRAEEADRALAYRVREQMLAALWSLGVTEGPGSRRPLVCTDVWYLNDDRLRYCPVVSIGGPGVNALTAYLADKAPGAFVVDDLYSVQLDVAYQDLHACIWGVDHEATRTAVDAFCSRYLKDFVAAAVGG